MIFARVLVLILAFSLDLRVRADDVIAAAEHRLTKRVGAARVSLAAGGLAVPVDGALRFVRGTLLVEGPIRLATPFADFACDAPRCAALVARGDDEVRLDALSDGWRVNPRGAGRALGVAVATRVVIGSVDPSGRARTEPPRSLAWAPLVRTWAGLFPRGVAEFRAEVRALRPLWERAVARVSEEQRGRALAMIDAERVNEDRRERARRAGLAEDRRLRELFRAKNFVED